MKPYTPVQKYIITALILWFTSISSYLAITLPPTNDEYTFVTSGYSYWKTGNFKLNTEQPPLVKLATTLPILLLNQVHFPADHPAWKKAQLFGNDGFYQHFIFTANKYKKELLLILPRLVNIIPAILLALLILRWATKLFGPTAGILALFLYSFEPTILAYSSILMIDIPFAFFSTLALYTLCTFLKKPTLKNYAFASITFALCQLTKYTAVLLLGIYPAILLGYLLAQKVKTPALFRERRLSFLLASYLGILLTTLFAINLAYLFNGTLQTAYEMFENDPTIDKKIYPPEKVFPPNTLSTVIAKTIPLPLPYPYVKGLGYVTLEAHAPRTTYLFGKTSTTGFKYYYLLSYLVKTPIPVLIALIIAFIYFIITPKKIERELTLILPITLFFILFSINSKQIGIRHILQTYPLIFIFLSRIALIKTKPSVKHVFTILFITFSIAEVALAFPDYISYANEIIGLNYGYLYFADTNLDLAQNLPQAITFIKNHPETKIAIGTADFLHQYTPYTPLTHCQKGLAIVDAVTLNTNQEYTWLRCKQPLQRLGRTLFTYNITQC